MANEIENPILPPVAFWDTGHFEIPVFQVREVDELTWMEFKEQLDREVEARNLCLHMDYNIERYTYIFDWHPKDAHGS